MSGFAYTEYCEKEVLRKRPYLKKEWCEAVVENPIRPKTDSLYIDLSSKPSAESREVSEGVVLDYDADGHVAGIDIVA